MNTYIDISQITHKLITALGKNSKGKAKEGGTLEENLLPYMQEYMDLTDKMYIELFTKKEIDVADVKDFASGLMTSTALRMNKYFAYYLFFEDNFGNPDVATSKKLSDAMYNAAAYFKKEYEELFNKITEFDITNEVEEINQEFPVWIPKEGFQ